MRTILLIEEPTTPPVRRRLPRATLWGAVRECLEWAAVAGLFIVCCTALLAAF